MKKWANFQNLKVCIFHPILIHIIELLMGHKKIGHFISERGLIGAQIPNGLCQHISSINNIFFLLKSYFDLGHSWCDNMVVGLSVHITTKVVSLNLEVHAMQHFVITFVSDLW